MPELKYLIVFLIAAIPALVWLYIFLNRHRENRWLVFFTFVGGILAAQLILLYKGYWDSTLNFIFFKVNLVDFRSNIQEIIVNGVLAAVVTFLSIGAMEEFAKFWIMKSVNRNFFNSIDDVIELSIVAALGFAFYENMVYFLGQWGKLSTGAFALLAVSRVTIVTMVHMLCSGILGYYFGRALFAAPILKIQHHQKKRHPVLNFFKTVFHMKTTHLYRDEMMAIGLVLSMGIHALYDFILSSTILIPPMVITLIILVYFFGGYWFLGYLLKKKEDQLELGHLTSELVPEREIIKMMRENSIK
jgi:RsiW-degrading membrane proteinase PrsW (M82 family)